MRLRGPGCPGPVPLALLPECWWVTGAGTVAGPARSSPGAQDEAEEMDDRAEVSRLIVIPVLDVLALVSWLWVQSGFSVVV